MDSHVESILATLNGRSSEPVRIEIEDVEVVGNCPRCGSPIYGPNSIPPGSRPNVLRTCSCLDQPKTFGDTIRVT